MSEVLRFCDEIITYLFDAYLSIRFLGVLLKNKVEDRRIWILCVLINIMIGMFVDYYVPYIGVNFLVNLISILGFSCCYQVSAHKRVIAGVTVDFVINSSEMLVALVIQKWAFNFFKEAANGDRIGFLLSRIVFWCVMILVEWYRCPKKKRELGTIWIIEGVTLIITFGELTIVCLQSNISEMVQTILLLSVELTICLDIYLRDCLGQIITEREQRKLIQKEKEYYHHEAKMLQENQETLRRFRHDWKNRLQVMNQLTEKGEWKELKQYLSRVSDKMRLGQSLSDSGNLAVDSIVNYKLSLAEERGIEIEAEISLPAKMKMDEDDMVVILGNLLDNAIEANAYVLGEKKMKCVLKYEDGCVMIHVENTFDRTWKKENGEYLTRKKDAALHGIGLKSVQNTVAQYDGVMEVEIKEDWFCVDILLYFT